MSLATLIALFFFWTVMGAGLSVLFWWLRKPDALRAPERVWDDPIGRALRADAAKRSAARALAQEPTPDELARRWRADRRRDRLEQHMAWTRDYKALLPRAEISTLTPNELREGIVAKVISPDGEETVFRSWGKAARTYEPDETKRLDDYDGWKTL